MLRAWDKEKVWVPEHWAGALFTEQEFMQFFEQTESIIAISASDEYTGKRCIDL